MLDELMNTLWQYAALGMFLIGKDPKDYPDEQPFEDAKREVRKTFEEVVTEIKQGIMNLN